MDKLSHTIHTQPAIVLGTLLAFEKLKTEQPNGWTVDCIAGYSVGEISALALAGVLDISNVIALIKVRAEAMQYASTSCLSAMAFVSGVSLHDASQLCEDLTNSRPDHYDHLSIAIDAHPNGVMLGGAELLINRVLNREHPLLSATQCQILRPPVSGAFHTAYMEPAVDIMQPTVTDMKFEQPRLSLYSNVTAAPYDDDDNIGALLLRQLVEPVQWRLTLMTVIDEVEFFREAVHFYELGCGKQLKSMMAKFDRKLVNRTHNVSV